MKRILILDGGLGTCLEQKYNIRFDSSTPLWSSDLLVSNPSTLLECQRDFAAVPVDVLLTATYQVSVQGFAGTRTCEFPNGIPSLDIPKFLETAVQVAEDATREHNGAVALSFGPYGACMTPSQEYGGRYDEAHDSQEALCDWHRERLGLFSRVQRLASRVGYIAMETIPRADEIASMRKALDGVPELASVPFWMCCLYPGDNECLPSGESPETALRTMLDPRLAKSTPWGVGINCTKVWKLTSLLKRYESALEMLVREGTLREWPALVLYPDGTNGEVYNTVTQAWEVPDDAARVTRVPWEEQLAEAVRGTETRGKWKQIVVGGCCMTSSEDISRLRRTLLTA
ncbi:Homocysteine S-methyltransferase [Metarhizium album ARSEF 1941]|uniref:Homocysteine S-methyltransferase n=1 Tax=Metarhizium album (strain ARSEF 1941) TaxID=1081103 RepID=A0A0B2X756_METAS|nr:Homocysteine S-methyltransferase [Metarhizium album ARSEF 1941]KHO01300.1 Homocysteine S-methyltransferase [Metarhizium album ARSEF 1941]